MCNYFVKGHYQVHLCVIILNWNQQFKIDVIFKHCYKKSTLIISGVHFDWKNKQKETSVRNRFE